MHMNQVVPGPVTDTDTTTRPVRMSVPKTAKDYVSKKIDDEIKFTSGIVNVSNIIKSFMCGLLSCMTCCCACCGCCGKHRAHSGMVKYDQDDDYKGMGEYEQRTVNVYEHCRTLTLTTPQSCATCCCCFGCCGMCGPWGVSEVVLCSSGKK